jgi:tetratricopeptide (TPR) repeat protein
MASLLENEGRTDEAERTYEQAVHAQEQLVDSFPTVAEYRTELAATHDHLNNLLLSEGRNSRADTHRAAAETLRSAAQSATQSKQITPIRFQNFADPTGLQLFGRTSVANDRLRLTPLAPNNAGVAWTAKKCLVALGFDTVFAFRLEGEADGFAFTVQNYKGTSMGSYGGSLGYGGIPNSLAVEFDTFSNQEFDDLPASHISVQTGGTGVNSADHVFSLSGVIVPVDLNDGNVHHVRIHYVPGTLTIFMDRSTEPMLAASVELSALLDLDCGRAWVGFTASTGSRLHSLEILSWQYAPLVDEDTADSFFRSYPPKVREPSHPLAAVQQKEAPLSESPRLSEDFAFLSKALAFYQAFAEQNRDDPDAQWQIGKAYWRVGEIMRILGGANKEGPVYRQSEEACQTAMKIWETLSGRLPADAEAIRQLARTFHRSGLVRYGLRDYEKAIQYYERSVQLDPGNAGFHNGLAWALALCPDPQFRDPQRAVTLAFEATRLDPNGPGPWNTLGVVQYRAGQWEKAIESLHKSDALENNKGSSYNGFFLAMAYWRTGKQDEARMWYDKAIRWMDENLPDDEELLRFRVEAAQLLNITENK